MASEIKVPTLGESVTEATIGQWLKQVGDSVAADEAVVELETDKVTLEVNAPEAGVLSEILAGEGENVEVGALLARIGEGGATAGKSETKAPAAAAAPAPAPASAPAPAVDAPAPTSAASSGGNGQTVDVPVPSLGESVTEATVAKWLKTPGEAVKADEAIAELETDKVTLEVNAPADGVLSEILAEEDSTVEAGGLLARISAGAGTATSAAPAPAAAPAPTTAPPPAAAAAPASGQLDPGSVARSGSGGKITAEDLRGWLSDQTPPSAQHLSPAVQRLVEQHGLDASLIEASGPKGRITKEDVLDVVEGRKPLRSRAAAGSASAPAQEARVQDTKAPLPSGTSGPREERVKMTKLRQTIARRLKEAQNTAAMLTTFNEIDMSGVMALRSRHKEAFEKKHGVKLGFMSFFAKACVAALESFPAVNARIDGDEIVYNKFFDIGMAVSTPQGLMVPVVRDCDAKSFAAVEAELGDLAGRARDGKIKMEELQGGSFSITNGGIFGSLLSTPILNPPQAGILGLHKIEERPIAVKGEVAIRPMMYVALSYDHRLVDGREAVGFLVKVKQAIEDPETLLLDL
ncbi:MAG: 2-oxoglutarate dehydrogenase complex dihydrolipoyllysine-residue succinyltransferase [Kiloniellales bacterium]